MPFSLYLKAPGEKRRPPGGLDAMVHLDEPGTPGLALHHDLPKFFSSPVFPGPAARAFLLTAMAVWAADKLCPRAQTPDAWTREITLHLPATAA